MSIKDRDEKGRYLPGNKWRFRPYKKPSPEIEKIRAAYIAGLNSNGSIERRPSVLADRYLRQQGYL